METSLYVALSRQTVLQRAMDLVANNIANANTAGYRAQNPMFQEYITDNLGDKSPLSMVYDLGQYDSTQAGVLQQTGNTYDVALSGPGFMAVTAPSGDTQYTRGGNFTVNSAGQLVTPSGYKVSGAGGNAISIPTGTQEVKITRQGEITADGNVVGKLSVVEFDNVQDITPEGNGLYSSKNEPHPATETDVLQGALENSNVNPIQETTRMIEISRLYQNTMRMIQNEQDRQNTAIQNLSKLTG